MNVNRFILLLFLCFAFPGPLVSYSQTPPDDAFVAIRFSDGADAQAIEEYYGSVDRKALAALQGNVTPNAFLKLNHVEVITDGKLVPLSEANYQGTPFGYGGTIYIRIDTIFRIVELDDTYVKQNWPPPAGK